MNVRLPGLAPLGGVLGAARPIRPVQVDYAPRIRAERLIASGRVLLAVFSLLAVWLDPTTPAKDLQLTHFLLAGYVVYAVALAARVWLAQASSPQFGIATHVVDLALFCAFIYLTEGPATPLFTYFLFATVAATLRWQWRGAVWTAAIALLAFNGIAVYAVTVIHDPAFALDRFLIRSVYLVVLASLLAFLGVYEQRRRSEMSQLTRWPRVLPRDLAVALREVLESAARVVGAPRAVLVWEEGDEPWLNLAAWSVRGFQQWQESPETFHPLVAEPLVGADFLTPDASAPVPSVLRASAAGPEQWRGTCINPDFVSRFVVKPALCVSVRGERVRGRLLFLDKRRASADDLGLGQVVASQLSESLDHLLLAREVRLAAAAEERERLSRDLHDGVLQSLTGAALKLETAQRLLETEPQAARERLAEIQRLIVEEQRNLRFFIRDKTLDPLSAAARDASLDACLRQLIERFESVWGLQVELEFAQLNGAADALAHDICRIVQEALVNAARHAGASEVRVTVEAERGDVRIAVADNGRGFPFHGFYDHEALTRLELGPVVLKERIDSLRGQLAIRSGPAGARLEIWLPVTSQRT